MKKFLAKNKAIKMIDAAGLAQENSNFSDLMILDWNASLHLAGNQTQLAKDILMHVIEHLSNDFSKIQSAYLSDNKADMLFQVHKLHGSLCYCGLPRLKMLIARLETNLKNNIMSDSSSLLHQLDKEICLLLKHIDYPNHAIAMAAMQHPAV